MLLGIATLLILILNICIVSLVPTAHQPFAIYCDVVKFAGYQKIFLIIQIPVVDKHNTGGTLGAGGCLVGEGLRAADVGMRTGPGQR